MTECDRCNQWYHTECVELESLHAIRYDVGVIMQSLGTGCDPKSSKVNHNLGDVKMSDKAQMLSDEQSSHSDSGLSSEPQVIPLSRVLF